MFTATMADAPFFYCPDLAQLGTTLALAPEEARHAAAQRLRVGDTITLFDGIGRGARAHIANLGGRGRDVSVAIDERFDAPPAPTPLMLYSALPKGERQATLLDMATQLGMTHFTPLVCERSIVQPGDGWQTRAQRICTEACKQSRRWHMPILSEPMSIAAALTSAHETTKCIWFAHPGGGAKARAADIPAIGVAIFVGPEGGFTDSEAQQADRVGALRVDLGPLLLRIETAAIALLAIAGR